MTAITKYERLEAPVLWRETPQAQARDTIAVLGKATLVIKDFRTEQALAHWSLPAVTRLNPGLLPAIYAPQAGHGVEPPETVEISDPEMIMALETIRHSLDRSGSLRRVLRWGAVGASALAAVLALVILPPALMDYTARVLPEAKRVQLGRLLLEDMTRTGTVRVCNRPSGQHVLAGLRSRVLGMGPRVVIVSGVPGLRIGQLPGQIIVLGEDEVMRLDSPEALAGLIMAQHLAAQSDDPLRALLSHVGTRGTLSLLTTGRIAPELLQGFGATHIARPLSFPPATGLVAALAAQGVSPAPFALSLPSTDADYAQALADVPHHPDRATSRLASDGEWITLQQICLP
jgi:hypothetical protein